MNSSTAPEPNAVTTSVQSDVALILIDNPPVNAVSHAVRAGVSDAIARAEADPAVRAIVILCAGKTFCAGADIREFGQPPREPILPAVVDRIESCGKPVVAAIHGTALGGGLEIALACHYRVAVAPAKLGLPEVKLGLMPGAGGTQRLPRLVGIEAAFRMISGGDPIDAARAREIGLVDEIVDGDLREGALRFASALVARKAPPRRTRDLPVQPAAAGFFDEAAKTLSTKQRGLPAPRRILEVLQAAGELPFDEGIARERAAFLELRESPESKALRHVFFAEREVARTPGLPADLPTRPISIAAVIGAGTMGQGIAAAFADAGITVRLFDADEKGLKRGHDAIRKIFDTKASRGSITPAQAAERAGNVQAVSSFEALGDADLFIEAVFEDMAVKQEVFRRLDALAKPGAILATNTSYLDVDAIAAVTKRPADVIGLHFFSPAHIMKLLEIVRGAETAPSIQATAMQLAGKLRKVGVLTGNCTGFVGNRMLAKRTRESYFLIEEGATPWQVDRALYDFGFPMGPFAVGDLAGLDIGWRNRKARFDSLTPREQACDILDEIVARGRLGQKTGAGYYRYDEKRRAQPDPDIEALIVAHSAKVGMERREIGDREILERCLYTMINEGARILEEGIVARPLDIDIVWIHGYGFPRHRGGPMFHADQIGLARVYEAILGYRDRFGAEYWTPAPLLERLVREGKGFYA